MNALDQDRRVDIKTLTGTAPNCLKSRADVENAVRTNIAQPKNLLDVLRYLPEVDFTFNQVLYILQKGIPTVLRLECPRRGYWEPEYPTNPSAVQPRDKTELPGASFLLGQPG